MFLIFLLTDFCWWRKVGWPSWVPQNKLWNFLTGKKPSILMVLFQYWIDYCQRGYAQNRLLSLSIVSWQELLSLSIYYPCKISVHYISYINYYYVLLMVDFFVSSSLNYVCPPNFNPSDFFVLTLAIVPEKEDECRNKVRVSIGVVQSMHQAFDRP